MDDAKIAWKIREKIQQFSGKLSAHLPKTAQRLVREVLLCTVRDTCGAPIPLKEADARIRTEVLRLWKS